MRSQRRTVAALARPGVSAARHVYATIPSDVLRVAALVEISAAAGALARTVAKLRHLHPQLIAPHVSSRSDLAAVLGHGRWLPSMVRHVPAPPGDPVPGWALTLPARPRPARRGTGHSSAAGEQPALFSLATARGGEPRCRA